MNCPKLIHNAPASIEESLIYLYLDRRGKRQELQLSYPACFLPELRAYCRRKNEFRRSGTLQGRLVLQVPQRTEDENRCLWKRRNGYSIHADHTSLRTENLRFFHELSVECAGENEPARLVAEGGVCRLLLAPTPFEDFFTFLSEFAEGYWAYRFDAADDMWVSSDIIDPTPALWERWCEWI